MDRPRILSQSMSLTNLEMAVTAIRTATLTSYYEDGPKSENCTVRISSGHIRIELDYGDSQQTAWEGLEREPGHFDLSCTATGGTGTLHRFYNDDRLEGAWHEQRGDGMWMLELDENEEEPAPIVGG